MPGLIPTSIIQLDLVSSGTGSPDVDLVYHSTDPHADISTADATSINTFPTQDSLTFTVTGTNVNVAKDAYAAAYCYSGFSGVYSLKATMMFCPLLGCDCYCTTAKSGPATITIQNTNLSPASTGALRVNRGETRLFSIPCVKNNTKPTVTMTPATSNPDMTVVAGITDSTGGTNTKTGTTAEVVSSIARSGGDGPIWIRVRGSTATSGTSNGFNIKATWTAGTCTGSKPTSSDSETTETLPFCPPGRSKVDPQKQEDASSDSLPTATLAGVVVAVAAAVAVIGAAVVMGLRRAAATRKRKESLSVATRDPSYSLSTVTHLYETINVAPGAEQSKEDVAYVGPTVTPALNQSSP